MADALDAGRTDHDVAALCYTSNTRQRRRSSIASRLAGTRADLDRVPCWATPCRARPEEPPRRRVAAGCGSDFCCTGQGAQYPGHDHAASSASCPPYRDRPDARPPPPSTRTLRGILAGCSTSMFSDGPTSSTPPSTLQPALFAVVVRHRRHAARAWRRARRSSSATAWVSSPPLSLAEVLTLDEAAATCGFARRGCCRQLPDGRCDERRSTRPRRTGLRILLQKSQPAESPPSNGPASTVVSGPARCRRARRHGAGPRRRRGDAAARLACVPLAAHGALHRRRCRAFADTVDTAQGDDPAHLDRSRHRHRRHRHGRRLLGRPAHLDRAIRRCDADRRRAGVPDPPRRTRPAHDPAGTCAAAAASTCRWHPGSLRRAERRRRRLRTRSSTSCTPMGSPPASTSLYEPVTDVETAAALCLRRRLPVLARTGHSGRHTGRNPLRRAVCATDPGPASDAGRRPRAARLAYPAARRRHRRLRRRADRSRRRYLGADLGCDSLLQLLPPSSIRSAPSLRGLPQAPVGEVLSAIRNVDDVRALRRRSASGGCPINIVDTVAARATSESLAYVFLADGTPASELALVVRRHGETRPRLCRAPPRPRHQCRRPRGAGGRIRASTTSPRCTESCSSAPSPSRASHLCVPRN